MTNPVIATFGRKLRVGVVGGGPGSFIGPIHRTAAQLHEQFEVVAGVFSSDPQRSLAAGQALGIARAYASAAEMIATEQAGDGLDLLAIMTPNDSHYSLSCMALEAGLDVICEKPLTNGLDEAKDLVKRVSESDRQFCVAYCYSGYPMVRQARAMVESGQLGEIRMVTSEYVQGHLATLTESEQQGSNWHMQKEVVGPSLILGDIATHSYHLASFITRMIPAEVSADVATLVPGRVADDYCGILSRYANNARGSFVVTQAAAGAVHGLKIRVVGSEGSIEWQQEQPNELLYRPLNAPAQLLTRDGPGLHQAAQRVTHVAIGHPEGYREAFANLYHDMAECMVARQQGVEADPLANWYPSVLQGAEGVAFVEAALASSRANGQWTALADLQRID